MSEAYANEKEKLNEALLALKEGEMLTWEEILDLCPIKVQNSLRFAVRVFLYPIFKKHILEHSRFYKNVQGKGYIRLDQNEACQMIKSNYDGDLKSSTHRMALKSKNLKWNRLTTSKRTLKLTMDAIGQCVMKLASKKLEEEALETFQNNTTISPESIISLLKKKDY